jgi:hypothetical protein
MKDFKTFEEAFFFQTNGADRNYNGINTVQTGVDVLDRIQFSVGEVVWVSLAEGFYLDDYDESVTQYGITASGKWAAVSGGHCSCYGWEEMCESDITYYDSLETLLKADPNSSVITKHKETIERVYSFVRIQ